MMKKKSREIEESWRKEKRVGQRRKDSGTILCFSADHLAFAVELQNNGGQMVGTKQISAH